MARNTGKQGDPTRVVSARFTPFERELLHAAAAAEGISLATLVRRLTFAGARELIAQRLEVTGGTDAAGAS